MKVVAVLGLVVICLSGCVAEDPYRVDDTVLGFGDSALS